MFDRRKPAAPAPFVTHENVEAKIKWFDPEKGFGFASPADGSGDVFVHVSSIGPQDPQDLQPGATIICDLGEGRRGLQVVAVHEIDASTATPAAPRARAAVALAAVVRSRRARPVTISAAAMGAAAVTTAATVAVSTVAIAAASIAALAPRWRDRSTAR
ncbi:cold shock domain-containing protein [Bosea vestrisii]|uniref:cold-shock protein n=1 Tax=Bosea vestrisii TaxID=151416 RepID=UPI0024DFE691|nr:cold shock domain-containing protein [Bosea vestrisii]WID98394.1 cold shock domain-containing protein [Bosea vestrisii]